MQDCPTYRLYPAFGLGVVPPYQGYLRVLILPYTLQLQTALVSKGRGYLQEMCIAVTQLGFLETMLFRELMDRTKATA